MDIARSTLDGQTYTAFAFSCLPPMVLADLRRQLTCAECDEPAFFRKASKSGRASCFGARPHRDGCSLAAPDAEHVVPREEADVKILSNPGARILVDFAFGAQPREIHGDPLMAGGASAGGTAPHYVGVTTRPDARMQRRLSSLLRMLIEAPQFRLSNQVIEAGGRQSRSTNYCVLPGALAQSVNLSRHGLLHSQAIRWPML